MSESNKGIDLSELYRAFDPSYAEEAWRNKESGGVNRDQPTRPAIGSNRLPTGNGIDPTKLEKTWRDRR